MSMKLVTVYDEDGLVFADEVPLHTVVPDFEEATYTMAHLQAHGSLWIGGGAAPRFRIIPVEFEDDTPQCPCCR